MNNLSSFYQFFLEMAAPVADELDRVYYHGTSYETAGQGILKDGFIKPKEDSLKYNTYLSPRPGRVYFTPDISFAIAYVLGRRVAGTDEFEIDHGHKPEPVKSAIRKELLENPFGYLFVIPGNQLKDIELDEDTVGEIIHDIYHRVKFTFSKGIDYSNITTDEKKFLDFAKSILSKVAFNRVIDGNYLWWAKAGKIILKNSKDLFLTPGITIHRWLLNQVKDYSIKGVSHSGSIKWSEAWQFDKLKTRKLKSDGSNFFVLAKRLA